MQPQLVGLKDKSVKSLNHLKNMQILFSKKLPKGNSSLNQQPLYKLLGFQNFQSDKQEKSSKEVKTDVKNDDSKGSQDKKSSSQRGQQSTNKQQKQEKKSSGKKKPKKNQEQNKQESSPPPKPQSFWKQQNNLYSNSQKIKLIGVSLFATIGAFWILSQNYSGKEITYQELRDALSQRKIKQLTLSKNESASAFQYVAIIDFIDGSKAYTVLGNIDSFLTKLEKEQRDLNRDVKEFVPIKYSQKKQLGGNNMIIFLALGISLYFFYTLTRNGGGSLKGKGSTTKRTGNSSSSSSSSSSSRFGGGGGFGDFWGMGKSTNVQVYGTDKKVKTRFKNVAGMDGPKEQVMEFVDFLKEPKKYQKLGARIPRGALLVGPPGTGKTLLAKAVAGEADVPFLSISGSDFVEMFVGVGASRVRDLFKKAKQKAPSIVFIDEIDAVGKKRNYKFSAGNDERDSTLNQLLVQMDGFGTQSNVIVLAATNRKDILDNALLRPGRFDRTVDIGLPNIKEREQIYNVHLKKIKVDRKYPKKEYCRRLASLTPGMSGADIENTCNEAAIIAARSNKNNVGLLEFEKATERVIAGLEKKVVISEMERTTVAYHEAGHAVAGWFLQFSNPLLKVTIVPRSKGSLGFAQYLPDQVSLYTKQQLLDMIKTALGGRISEQIFFGRVTTGASDDIRKVTQIAQNLVTQFGMSERIGLIGYEQGQYGDKPYSQNTAQIIDEEVKSIVDKCYKETKELLISKKQLIQKQVRTMQQYLYSLAKQLLDKETITLKTILSVLGERPYPMKQNVKEYLKQIEEQEQNAQNQQDQEEQEDDQDDQDKQNQDDEGEDDQDQNKKKQYKQSDNKKQAEDKTDPKSQQKKGTDSKQTKQKSDSSSSSSQQKM